MYLSEHVVLIGSAFFTVPLPLMKGSQTYLSRYRRFVLELLYTVYIITIFEIYPGCLSTIGVFLLLYHSV